MGIVALGLLVATFVGWRSLEKMRLADEGITVKVWVEKRITSVSSYSAAKSYSLIKISPLASTNCRNSSRWTLDFLKGKGIPEESIEEGTINTSTTCKRDFRGHATSEADSFKLTQTFTV